MYLLKVLNSITLEGKQENAKHRAGMSKYLFLVSFFKLHLFYLTSRPFLFGNSQLNHLFKLLCSPGLSEQWCSQVLMTLLLFLHDLFVHFSLAADHHSSLKDRKKGVV
jgi:hypothetical protein